MHEAHTPPEKQAVAETPVEKRYFAISPDGFPFHPEPQFAEDLAMSMFKAGLSYGYQGHYTDSNLERIPLEELPDRVRVEAADENRPDLKYFVVIGHPEFKDQEIQEIRACDSEEAEKIFCRNLAVDFDPEREIYVDFILEISGPVKNLCD